MPPDLGAMLRECDAAVVIGDTALRATFIDGPRLGLSVLDLGAAWHEHLGAADGLRAVGGPPRLRRARIRSRSSRWPMRFAASLDLALAQVDEVARDAARWEAFDPELLARYFTTLDFRLGRPSAGGAYASSPSVRPQAGEVPLLPEIRFATVANEPPWPAENRSN